VDCHCEPLQVAWQSYGIATSPSLRSGLRLTSLLATFGVATCLRAVAQHRQACPHSPERSDGRRAPTARNDRLDCHALTLSGSQ
jgi:hypothetical protein